MNSGACNSAGITYHQISMYEYEFCTSRAINQNIDGINRLSWKFMTIFAIRLYCSSILMQDCKKIKKCFKQFNYILWKRVYLIFLWSCRDFCIILWIKSIKINKLDKASNQKKYFKSHILKVESIEKIKI